jgi:hypothetical protein
MILWVLPKIGGRVNPSRNSDILLLKLEPFEKKEYSSHQNEIDARSIHSFLEIFY